MGKHSIKGILSGLPLNVIGKASKHVPRHAISGGEYTTVNEPLVGASWRTPQGDWDLSLRFVQVTYSIAPQGPNKPLFRDKAHPCEEHNTCGCKEWRRPDPMGGTGATVIAIDRVRTKGVKTPDMVAAYVDSKGSVSTNPEDGMFVGYVYEPLNRTLQRGDYGFGKTY